jgi:hypothetical protein
VPLLIVAMFLAGMVGCGLLGVAIERFAYRPLRDAPRIAPLISALGVSFFLQSSALLLFTARFRSYDTPKLISFGTGLDVGPLRISLVRILVIVTAVALQPAHFLALSVELAAALLAPPGGPYWPSALHGPAGAPPVAAAPPSAGATSFLAAGLPAGWNTPSTRSGVVPVFSRQCSTGGGRCRHDPAPIGREPSSRCSSPSPPRT